MNAGYSSGWCEESFGLPLEAREISCRAAGHDRCRFVMAPAQHLEQRIEEYLEHSPSSRAEYDSIQQARVPLV